MEIDFIHEQKELVISKVIFTDSKIYCTNVFPNRKPEIPNINENQLSQYLPHFNSGYNPLSMSNFVSITGEVIINSLKSISYSSVSDKFILCIQDNYKHFLVITIQYVVALYIDQITEVLRILNVIAYPTLINSIVQNLSLEKPVKIGYIYLFLNGVSLDWKRVFKIDKILVPWNRLTYEILNNNIIVKEYNSRLIRSEISTSYENVCLIPQLIDFMQNRR